MIDGEKEWRGEQKEEGRGNQRIREQGELEAERRREEMKLPGLFSNRDQHKILQAAKSTYESQTVWSYD